MTNPTPEQQDRNDRLNRRVRRTAPDMVAGVREDRLDWLLGELWIAKDQIMAWTVYMDEAFRWAKDETRVMPEQPE